MTITSDSKTNLYDRDFYQWIQETTEKLKTKDFDHVDLVNLIEEIESLGTSERSEILNRLATLLEHLLKRMFVDMPQEFNGWERIIREQRRQIKRTLKTSPTDHCLLSNVAVTQELMGVAEQRPSILGF
ncbi:MAG: hypothetical protein AUK48_15830 [Oscillatoriales cyanobacterium CG2_30_44_21]|nr:MAG: hypothetical protein AUK48_15830 [Oscillatoriales cyanobacterium CG2_30_44_21]